MAAPSAIGTASAYGEIIVDGSRVTGNATVFDGTQIETGLATTDVRLQRGAQLRFAAQSRGKVFGDRLVLQSGATEMRNLRSFRLQAGKLDIEPADASARGVVAIAGPNRIQVSSTQGQFDVKAGTMLVARVSAGRALTFDGEPSGAAAPMTFTGTISREEGRYFATVPDTGLKYEITGQDFSNVTGKNATITGAADVAATPHSGAAAVVTVSNVSPVGSGAVAGGAGMGLGAKAFIVGVVVGGGTGLGYGIHHLIENNGSSQ